MVICLPISGLIREVVLISNMKSWGKYHLGLEKTGLSSEVVLIATFYCIYVVRNISSKRRTDIQITTRASRNILHAYFKTSSTLFTELGCN